MSNLRTFWIIWCSMWALGWLLIGFFTFFIGWLFVPVSLLAILIPVGSNKELRGSTDLAQPAVPPASPES